ncbi:uncharacterized protein LOC135345276 isoform X2 [Halichondria panicea]|uniref:uncharacterized protein LOC135345276 isoform X2 n=1 Tax=Halichondria panicea TaxID=6063 RepID=UPI00312BBD6E
MNCATSKTKSCHEGRDKYSKISCKGVNFKPLRGLEEEERRNLLQEVQCGELSLKDLSQKCKVIKKMKEIKLAFITQLDIGSWEEALQLYPTHTSDENLAQFTSLYFKKSNVPQTFCSFCTQAKQAILNKSIEQPTSVTDGLHVSYDNSFAVIINANVITVSTRELLDGFGSLQCSGLHLTILDTPEDWSCTEVTTIVRLVRSTNIALGLSSFAVVVISPPQDLELQQQDCKAQTAYMQDTSAASKDTYTGCDLQNTITPMVIGQWSSCNEYPFFAKKTEFVGNLLTVAMDEPINTPQGRARPKPMLYQELIKLLTSPGQWVFEWE